MVKRMSRRNRRSRISRRHRSARRNKVGGGLLQDIGKQAANLVVPVGFVSLRNVLGGARKGQIGGSRRPQFLAGLGKLASQLVVPVGLIAARDGLRNSTRRRRR